MSQKVMVSVIIKPVVPVERLHVYDAECVPGRADVVIDASVEKTRWADAALDAFHSAIPIKSLDDFELSVVFEGEALECRDDHESYSLAGLADVVDSVYGFDDADNAPMQEPADASPR
ncbi:hypothetical protein [Alcanivorax sp. 1008]|uniref:hypothetical protein n=1 Tax=Alcanivorax sp. 1008 TaxID=2816853 RepID=UPI001DA90709|nr:hypothetical protein [Alcanivorax sp. 1008]MCC1496781.1 hypothetical protein [Alcanivorax sp. 1008]